jgi:adenylosuccinate synthase
MHPDVLRQRIERGIFDANQIITFYGREPLDAEAVFNETLTYTERLRPYVTDTMQFLNRAWREQRTILVEGAQATLLDVDHGTYPYVTSSSTTAGGVAIGTGLAPTRITGVLGIVRTYATRVGEGPFPTEMLGAEDDICHLIRERGREYGSVTKRPRRCGWFDAFATRYAADINGFSSVALTKLDVLDALDELKVCVGYKLDGQEIDYFPAVAADLRRVEPIYQTLPGWRVSTEGITELDKLPPNARAYIDFLSAQIGVEIGLVSTGPERTQTILVQASALGRWLAA